MPNTSILQEKEKISMKKIGLIGGLSWQSTVEYYRVINEESNRRLGGGPVSYTHLLFAAGRAVVITIFSQNIQLLNIY